MQGRRDHADDSRRLAFVHCVRRRRGHAQLEDAEPTPEDIARGKALTDAGDCASCHTADPAKPFAGGKRIDTPFGGIYSPNLTPDRDTGPRRVERRRVLPRVALRRGARRFALLSGLPLSEFHEADPPGHFRHPRLSGDADAGPQYAARAGAALAAELSRRHARLELAVLQARHSDAGPAKERGMESRPLSGRGRRPLRRLPHAEEHVWRRQTRPGLRRRPRRGHVRAAARCARSAAA